MIAVRLVHFRAQSFKPEKAYPGLLEILIVIDSSLKEDFS